MNDKILSSVKKQLGIAEADNSFDEDVTICTNAAFSVLNQVGIGPVNGFSISTGEETWSEYETDDVIIGMVKPYVFMSVKLKFDPPQNSSLLQSTKEQLLEIEWRLLVQSEKNVS